jgi:alginate O-acetyltransferase complex protein AlgI
LLFNSYPFIFIFLPLVVVAFFALPAQVPRLAFLVLASYVFYGYAEWWFPALMVTTTAVSFTAGRVIDMRADSGERKAVLAFAIVACLSLLAYFKYAEFVSGYVSGVVSIVSRPGLPGLKEFTHGIVLPAGISFFTFEAISYMIDVHRGQIEAERNVLRYALFISFFPHLIAGPIVRYGQLAPQLHQRYRFDPDKFRSGLMLFSIGLSKKVLLADRISFRIDPALSDPSHLGFASGWLALFGYSFQIYLDFSAYTDMAMGLARMFGIELPWNFDRPYRAGNPSEFWRRWHVTLSSWLRDYLYIPLGGNRKGELRRDANLFATMGLGGLWHGASLNFVVWGLYHGALLSGHRRLERRLSLPRPVAVAGTYLLVTIGWAFFRLHSAADVGQMFAAMSGLHGRGSAMTGLLPYLAIAAALMWCVPEERTWSLAEWRTGRLAALAFVTALAIVSLNFTQKFIYFQF